MLHPPKLANKRAELLAVIPAVLRRVLPGPERKTSHLRRDAYPSFVQQADGIFIALPLLAQEVAGGDLDIVEIEDAGAGSADTEFLLLLRDSEALGALFNDE